MNISEMGGGTPIGVLRKDVQEKIQMTQNNNSGYDNDQRQRDEDAIDELINQINTETDESQPKKKTNKIKSNKKNKLDTDTDEDKKEKKEVKKNKFKFPFKIPEFIRDPLLIWVIFILLSQNFIKQLIGKYVNHINPNEDGVVSFLGVVIYGLIFAVLFAIIKFLLNMIL